MIWHRESRSSFVFEGERHAKCGMLRLSRLHPHIHFRYFGHAPIPQRFCSCFYAFRPASSRRLTDTDDVHNLVDRVRLLVLR
jgi:hypothetical protein